MAFAVQVRLLERSPFWGLIISGKKNSLQICVSAIIRKVIESLNVSLYIAQTETIGSNVTKSFFESI